MTVTELREALQALEAQGKGALEVRTNDAEYGWDTVQSCRIVSMCTNRISGSEYPDFVGIESV